MDDLRVLVVDDSALYRKLLTDLLGGIPGIEVVGTAPNGRFALEGIARFEPDVVTLDVEMPDMDGLEVLRRMRSAGADPLVVMVSALTKRGAKVTFDALRLGAFDFVSKPEGRSACESRSDLEGQLKPILAGARKCRESRSRPPVPKIDRPTIPSRTARGNGPVAPPGGRARFGGKGRPEIVAVGVSTGGPAALGRMLSMLPSGFAVPILIVQHIPEGFSEMLVESLNRKCALPVKVGRDGRAIEPGTVYLAPGGRQMKVAPATDGRGGILRITGDPPENNCRPSVDYLMRSVAHLFQERAIGVIMTGMGMDGVLGLKLMKRHGVCVIAQDEKSCVVFGMPEEAIRAGVVDIVLPLSRIAGEIVAQVERRHVAKA